jgi:hypothetical protein
MAAGEHPVVEEQVRRCPDVVGLCELDRDQEGNLVDGRVFAWGLVFDDGVHTVSTDGRERGSFVSLDSALSLFGRVSEVGLVWPPGAHAEESAF